MAPKASWLDRAIAYLTPARGLARAQARVAMQVALAYEGAAKGRTMEGWTSARGSTSADAEISDAHILLRDRARDLIRNNAHAASGLDVIVSNKIGTGILCQPTGPNERVNQSLLDRWNRWVDRCDLTGRHDFYGLQSLVERTRCEAGEVLIRVVRTTPDSPKDVGLRLHVLEPDFLDSDLNQVIDDRRQIRFGIETVDGIPVAYWLYDFHPGDSAASLTARRATRQSRRYGANEIIHYYKQQRPGQSRGVTDFAPVLVRLRALDDYDAAEVMRKKIAACLVGFVTTPAGFPAGSLAPTDQRDDGRHFENFEPGMVSYGAPGESVVFNDPHPSGDYDVFITKQLKAIAAGLHIPYELLAKDLVEVSYISGRLGLVQFKNTIEVDQWQTLIPQVCRPICEEFSTVAGIVDGRINPEASWRYTPPRFALLNPKEEIPAMVEAMQSGIDSYPNVVRGQGYDWEEKLDEIEEFYRAVDERGLRLTSDARVSDPEPPTPMVSSGGTPNADAA